MTPAVSTEALDQFLQEAIPFNRFLGIRVAGCREGWGKLELPFREEFIGDPLRPALHGGLVSTLLDTCGGYAVFTNAEPNVRLSTIDLRIDFLRPGKPELLFAECRVVRIGNRVAVTDGIAYHPSAPGEPIATAKGVYSLYKAAV